MHEYIGSKMQVKTRPVGQVGNEVPVGEKQESPFSSMIRELHRTMVENDGYKRLLLAGLKRLETPQQRKENVQDVSNKKQISVISNIGKILTKGSLIVGGAFLLGGIALAIPVTAPIVASVGVLGATTAGALGNALFFAGIGLATYVMGEIGGELEKSLGRVKEKKDSPLKKFLKDVAPIAQRFIDAAAKTMKDMKKKQEEARVQKQTANQEEIGAQKPT